MNFSVVVAEHSPQLYFWSDSRIICFVERCEIQPYVLLYPNSNVTYNLIFFQILFKRKSPNGKGKGKGGRKGREEENSPPEINFWLRHYPTYLYQ